MENKFEFKNPKIVPHLWFNKEAKEAAEFYITIFEDSKINNVSTITDTPSGNCNIVSFTLCNQQFQAINAGEYFKINPSISFFVSFNDESKLDNVWSKLVEGAKVIMPLGPYPWTTKYGWLQDKYGLSWRLSINNCEQKIVPMLMFSGKVAGKAEAAINKYTSIFPHSKVGLIVPFGKNDYDVEGYLKHGEFTINNVNFFMAMDTSNTLEYGFNEAVSLIAYCDSQEEIDYLWEKLSAVPEAERCGWLKDEFGISWQIIPTVMGKMITSGNKEKIARVTQAFLKMKKFDIKTLENEFNKD